MLVVMMKQGSSLKEIGAVLKRVEGLGLKPHLSKDDERTMIGVMGEVDGAELLQSLTDLSGVERVVPMQQPFKLASREFQGSNTVISLGEVAIGSKEVIMMAGPCAVESRETLLETAGFLREAGVRVMRGGAFKPRSSPYSFQGLGKKGLEILAEARERFGMLVVTEVMDPSQVDLVAEYADILQVGARNMQNFTLLQALGQCRKPVLLKRGMMSTLEEFFMSAEYILSSGNPRVILCERGIRTFEQMTRNTLDVAAVPVAKMLSHLPILVDPSHAAGRWDLVAPLALAGVAAGADGILIEVHPNPEKALSDGPQSLKLEKFASLLEQVKKVASALGRTLG